MKVDKINVAAGGADAATRVVLRIATTTARSLRSHSGQEFHAHKMSVVARIYKRRLWIIRPPDIVVGGLKFAAILLSIYIYLLFVVSYSQLPSELTERNSAKTGHMFGSECDSKIHVRRMRR